MATDAWARIAALRHSHDDLARFVDDFDEKLLVTPSGAADWTVAQVLTHLGSGAEIAYLRLRAAVEGRSGPGRDALPAIWERWRSLRPIDAVPAFSEFDGRSVHELEQLDDAALERLRVDVGFLPAPVDVATFVTFRLLEHALHSWDVHVAFDERAALDGQLVPFVVPGLAAMAGWIARPGTTSGRVLVESSDPDLRYLLVLGGETTMAPEPAPTVDAGTRLRLPAEAMARLLAGRLAPSRTPSTVDITGELDLDDLRAAFPGY